MQVLADASMKSRTAKLWITCVISPVLTMMQYVQAEREADWPLHLATVKNMMPLFFAAAHFNYARYGRFGGGACQVALLQEFLVEARPDARQRESKLSHPIGCFRINQSFPSINTCNRLATGL